MRFSRAFPLVTLALLALASPAAATTMIRQGLETLTAGNESVVLGRVIDIHSYWNQDRNFIYTDVRLRTSQTLKGRPGGGEVTFTLMGGTVGETTVLIVGGPELIPGSEYLLFLSTDDLAAGRRAFTVRDLSQGSFEIATRGGRPRAFSQALRHPLLPDAEGVAEPPGGAEGMALDDLLQRVRSLASDR